VVTDKKPSITDRQSAKKEAGGHNAGRQSMSEDPSIVFGEFTKKQMTFEAKTIGEIQKKHLKKISQDLVKQVIDNYKQGVQFRIKAASNIEPKSSLVNAYSTVLKENLGRVADHAAQNALGHARKKIKFNEIHFAEKKPGKAYADVTASTLAETQSADMKKAIALQYGSSYGRTTDEETLESDLTGASDDKIEGIIGDAGTTVGEVVNKTREEVFFDPEMKSEIESFTFINEDPISPICQYMNGKTIDMNDQDALAEYTPPMHHNCKSFLSPNFRGEDNPKSDVIAPDEKAKKSITLGSYNV
jgi:hypothetical protein